MNNNMHKHATVYKAAMSKVADQRTPTRRAFDWLMEAFGAEPALLGSQAPLPEYSFINKSRPASQSYIKQLNAQAGITPDMMESDEMKPEPYFYHQEEGLKAKPTASGTIPAYPYWNVYTDPSMLHSAMTEGAINNHSRLQRNAWTKHHNIDPNTAEYNGVKQVWNAFSQLNRNDFRQNSEVKGIDYNKVGKPDGVRPHIWKELLKQAPLIMKNTNPLKPHTAMPALSAAPAKGPTDIG
jgi:hypothetical protein